MSLQVEKLEEYGKAYIEASAESLRRLLKAYQKSKNKINVQGFRRERRLC